MVYKDSSEKIKKICLKTFDELKANDIKELNIEKISSFASYLLIATGTSNRHIKSIADKVVDALKESKIDILGKMHEVSIIEDSPYDSENKLLRA